jgi:hypothetical protein
MGIENVGKIFCDHFRKLILVSVIRSGVEGVVVEIRKTQSKVFEIVLFDNCLA